jgi:undecaprenyl-diphosphatase
MRPLQLPHKRKKILSWLIATALLMPVFVAWLVFLSDRNYLDQKIFSLIAPHIFESRTRFMLAVSFLGNHQFLIPANLLLIVFFLVGKNKWAAIRVTVVALGSLGLMSLLKNLFHRHRPENPLVQGITNFSFPSGHAFMSTAFYGLLIWWAASNMQNKWQRGIVIVFLILLVLLIGFSRIYLRVHYATDVITGYCIGFVSLILFLTIIDQLEEKYSGAAK